MVYLCSETWLQKKILSQNLQVLSVCSPQKKHSPLLTFSGFLTIFAFTSGLSSLALTSVFWVVTWWALLWSFTCFVSSLEHLSIVSSLAFISSFPSWKLKFGFLLVFFSSNLFDLLKLFNINVEINQILTYNFLRFANGCKHAFFWSLSRFGEGLML